MNKWIALVAMAAVGNIVHAGDLCTINPYTQADAEQGKAAFNSHCAYCHQYSMTGRVPGNSAKESPDLNVLSEGDVKFLDNAGGNVPPLVGTAFFRKWDGKTLVDFSSTVSSAANTFPTKNFQLPASYFQIAAYVLYRNCGKM